jgi:protein tyrosine/serine phosphatase
MKRRIGLWLALAAAIAAITAAGAAQRQETRYRELPNFHQVNDHLYRGGQPEQGGLKKLSELGIKTIVNLRGVSDGTRGDRDEAEKFDMRYFNIPISPLGRPDDERVEQLLDIIDDRNNWPVFVHCQRGSDRTGVIIAVYRISRDGWNEKQAIDEAKRFGMAAIQFRKPSPGISISAPASPSPNLRHLRFFVVKVHGYYSSPAMFSKTRKRL